MAANGSTSPADMPSLSPQDNELRLYLSDNNYRPRSAEGATAQATVLAAGKQATVTLLPDGPDMLRGQGDFTAAQGMRVVVVLTLPGQAGPGPVHTDGHRVMRATLAIAQPFLRHSNALTD